jgi:hypothetical protein
MNEKEKFEFEEMELKAMAMIICAETLIFEVKQFNKGISDPTEYREALESQIISFINEILDKKRNERVV